MPSTSKSNRRRSKRSKFVPKPKQEWRVKQPERNWLELPSDLMMNILQRIGVSDILENAQKVCTAWREICKDPGMWRVIRMDTFPGPCEGLAYRQMFKHAVDRSQGQSVDLTIIAFCDQELLQYVADRSTQLRRLEIICDWRHMIGTWGEAFSKLSLLEELSVVEISQEEIEAVGRYCPLLKTLKWNQTIRNQHASDVDEVVTYFIHNVRALAIGKNLPGLTHLELIANDMGNVGLQAILDGCCHLESLDLRRCFYLDLKGDLGKRCSQQIRDLKLPHDSLKGYDDFMKRFFLLHLSAYDECDGSSDYDESGGSSDYDECDGSSDYDESDGSSDYD